jgi:pantoate--beta-alanine ligase
MKINTRIIGCPIFREMSGLAMSSRNERLSSTEIESAAFIYATLKQVRLQNNTAKEKKTWATQQFEKHPLLTLDYFEIVSEKSLRFIDPDYSVKQRAFVAAFIGGVRLIDNIELNN